MPKGYPLLRPVRRKPQHPAAPDRYFLSVVNLLDDDAAEDDYDICQAVVAGKVGLEPSGRSNDHDPLSLEPWRMRQAHNLATKERKLPRCAQIAREAQQPQFNPATHLDPHAGLHQAGTP